MNESSPSSATITGFIKLWPPLDTKLKGNGADAIVKAYGDKFGYIHGRSIQGTIALLGGVCVYDPSRGDGCSHIVSVVFDRQCARAADFEWLLKALMAHSSVQDGYVTLKWSEGFTETYTYDTHSFGHYVSSNVMKKADAVFATFDHAAVG
jgi:hypothetical protein